MELKVSHDTVSINEVIFEGSADQPVDLDVNLPDYCPDISRILKCRLMPTVSVRQITGDRLQVEGKTLVSVLYVDDTNRRVQCMEQSLPFAQSFALQGAPEDAAVFSSTIIDYVNCRASSPRRLGIHGSFTVSVKVRGRADCQVVTQAEGAGMQLLRHAEPISSVIGMTERQFSMNEMLELGQSKPAAATLVRSSTTILISDYKAIANKVIVKGDIQIATLYQCQDSDDMEKMEHSLPFSQIIDLDGVTDESFCDIHCETVSADIQIRTDGAGENRLLSADLRLSLQVTAYQSAEISLIRDAFSTECEIETDLSEIRAERMQGTLRYDGVYKNAFELPSGDITAICDLWCDAGVVSCVPADGKLLVKAPVNVNVLALDGDGCPTYFERVAEIEYEEALPDGVTLALCDPTLCITSCSFSFTQTQSIEVKIEYRLEGCIFIPFQENAICDLRLCEDQPIVRESTAALVIYYADQGERIWDIARKYCTSVSAIKEENELSEDVVPARGMMMIPSI